MHFALITPSFKQLDYLKRCVASVRDQVATANLAPLATRSQRKANRSFRVHHHIQDGGGSDEICEYLAKQLANSQQEIASDYSFSYLSEKDDGMYDALNRGLQRRLDSPEAEKPASCCPSVIRSRDNGIVAWLNCDEQYLPGTLQRVANYFETHPEVDLLFGGALLVDEKGELLACRKAMPMRKPFLEASYLYNLSCAMFFRQSLWEQVGGFDTFFKNAADEEWVLRALRGGAKCGLLNDYLSTFLYYSDNLSSDPGALEEHERIKQSLAPAMRYLKVPLNLMRLTEKFLRSGHRQRTPVDYDIYVDDGNKRTKTVCENPTCKWPGHSVPYLANHRLKKEAG